MIHCPWHQDNNPSLRVSLEKPGLFKCFACPEGKGSWNKLATKLGLQLYDETQEENLETVLLPRLEALDLETPPASEKTASVGIVSEEPWRWQAWGYREIRASSLLAEDSYIHKTFKPTLVRLWLGKNGWQHQERYSRLCLHYGEHKVFARLSSYQKMKYYNSSGLSLKDPCLHPFGLSSFSLPKKQAGFIIVEGPYDLLRTVQNLEDLGVKDQFIVVALLGVSHWDSFFRKLELRLLPQMGDTPLILAFDNDKAGRDLTVRASTACRTKLFRKPLVLSYPDHLKDPGSCDKNILERSLIALGY